MFERRLNAACSDIINEAFSKLSESYILPDKRKCGWRNGFKRNIQPGPTATALGLEFLCRHDAFPSKVKIDEILTSLVACQLKDNSSPPQKTGWEVMSMKNANARSAPSIDATASVIKSLKYVANYKKIKCLVNKGLDAKVATAIKDGQEWLLEKAQQKHWGVHEKDANRIFVMCNILDAIDQMGEISTSIRSEMLTEILNAQMSNGGWCAAVNTVDMPATIFHTARVLNYLEGLKAKDPRIVSAIAKGVKYLKSNMQTPTQKCYTEEQVQGCTGEIKVFYHDHYSEWLKHICNSTEWTAKDFYRVLRLFIKSHMLTEAKFYRTINNKSEEKDQVWLLLPAAMQCIDNNRYIAKHRRSLFYTPIFQSRYSRGIKFTILLTVIIIPLAMILKKYWLFTTVMLPIALNVISSYIPTISSRKQ